MSLALPKPDQVPVTLIDSDEKLEQLCNDVVAKWVAAALDTETVILRDADGVPLPRDLSVDAEGEGPGPLRVVSLAGRDPEDNYHAFVIDMGYVDALKLKITLGTRRYFMWNAPFDQLVLGRVGINLQAWDVMIGEAIERTGAGSGDARKYTSLAKASRKLLGFDIEGKDSVRTDYRTVEERPELSEEEITYAAQDTIVTLLVARIIGQRLQEAGLTETFVRDCNGQPFIAAMQNAGLPLQPAYADVVNAERRAMNIAAERVALATTGREMLETLFKWGKATSRLEIDEFDSEAALGLLHDKDTFGVFLHDIEAQAFSSRERIGKALDLEPVPNLFADEPEDGEEQKFTPLPFDPSNDVEVRRWFTKTAPHFAAALAIATRESSDPQQWFGTSKEQVLLHAGRKKALTKDTDLDLVLSHASKAPADVDQKTAAVALELAAYRRYSRILAQYGRDAEQHDAQFLLPTWDLASAPQVKAMFNTYAAEEVKAHFARTTGQARLFETADSADADALKLIGGELASAMLEWRGRAKIVSTYGDELLQRANPVTGRVHAKYNQSLTGTGRLSSYAPNAQNLSPLAKPYIAPPLVDGAVRRVLVCTDLSQAELRFVADAAQDVEMLSAFASGEDLHERTAALMFSLDMKALKAAGSTPVVQLVGKVAGIEPFAAADKAKSDQEPDHLALAADKLYKTQRSKAKSVAFGYAYGLKGASLARQLTVQGVPTTKEEADALLAAFDKAYPQLAAWMQVRVDFINALADKMRDVRKPSGVDFAATWLLHNTHAKAHSAYNALRKTLGRDPEDTELVDKLKPALTADFAALEASKDQMSTEEYIAKGKALADERARVAKLARWALSHDHAVALTTEGVPWEFESRTAGGRRRRFQVVTKYLMLALAVQSVRSKKDEVIAMRNAWVASWNERVTAQHEQLKEEGKARGNVKLVSLTNRNGGMLETKEIEKVFEDTTLRDDFIMFAISTLPAGQMERMWRLAMADRIRFLSNQYRNHPIQGGVADAVMIAFGDLHKDLTSKFPTAKPIQSVHDSIVVECDVEDALAVRDLVVMRMENGLKAFCPTVKCVADGDIQLSLDDSTKIDESQLAELIDQAKAA